jgi:hypothetical protein
MRVPTIVAGAIMPDAHRGNVGALEIVISFDVRKPWPASRGAWCHNGGREPVEIGPGVRQFELTPARIADRVLPPWAVTIAQVFDDCARDLNRYFPNLLPSRSASLSARRAAFVLKARRNFIVAHGCNSDRKRPTLRRSTRSWRLQLAGRDTR